MKNIRKILGSRYFLIAICILLELIQLLSIFMFLYTNLVSVVVVFYLFNFAVLLYIINKDDIPESKFLGLTIVPIFPVVGAFFYLLISNRYIGKKKLDKIKAIPAALEPYHIQTSAIENLKKKDIFAYTQANYLYNTAKAPCHENNKVTYYPLGEDFHKAHIEALKTAKHFIFMEYFIIRQGKMWDETLEVLVNKVKDGVRVCLLYDDFGCMTTLPSKYYKELCRLGIECFPSNKFTPVISQAHNNRDHRKITVIDGLIGFTGGTNLADEYINELVCFGHWKDTAVKIEGSAVESLTILFLGTWNRQSKNQLDYEKYLNIKQSSFEDDGYIIPYGDGPAPYYKETIGKNVYLNIINTATDYVYIMTPYLICDSEVMNSLKIAAKKGIDVRIITPHIPDKKAVFIMTRASYMPLVEDGVKIYEYTPGFIHAKGFISDDKIAVCGTINMDYRSLVHHFECGLWMYGTSCIKDMKKDFLSTEAVSEFITKEKAHLSTWQNFLRNIMKLFAPLM